MVFRLKLLVLDKAHQLFVDINKVVPGIRQSHHQALKRQLVKSALSTASTDVAYHRYPGVGHGFGLGIGTSAEGWIADALRFWAKHIDERRTVSN